MSRRSHRRSRASRRSDIWPRAWRRRPVAVAVALLVAIVVLWGRLSVPFGSDHDRYHNQTFLCIDVIDGDTIDIAVPDGDDPHTRIRLWGVDTPEVRGRGGVMYYGPEASAFAESLVLDESVRVVLSPDRTRGKYGRLLAYVYLPDGGTMLNEELLRRGYAYADHRFPHAWKERFADLEARARRDKVGLWAEVQPDQMPEWRQRYEQWREKK